MKTSTVIGDQLGIASNNSNLGSVYRSLGEYKKAIKYYEKGLEVSTVIGDQSGTAGDNGNLGEYQKAIKYYEKGLE